MISDIHANLAVNISDLMRNPQPWKLPRPNSKIRSDMRPSIPTPFPRSYWVIPGHLLAGAYPGAKDPAEAAAKLAAMFDAGIRTTINLMEADERDHTGKPFADYSGIFQGIAAAHGERVACERFPIPDLGVPDAEGMRRILDAIDASLEVHQPVYVHCWGGIGRTGTVVGCFLVRHGLADGDTAIDRIRRLRQRDSHKHQPSPETPEQAAFVKSWRRHEGGPVIRIDRYLGCMLGGAVGDALGAPVEFASLTDIRRRYGSEGIQDCDQAYGRVGAITDDTQMTLFHRRGDAPGLCSRKCPGRLSPAVGGASRLRPVAQHPGGKVPFLMGGKQGRMAARGESTPRPPGSRKHLPVRPAAGENGHNRGPGQQQQRVRRGHAGGPGGAYRG